MGLLFGNERTDPMLNQLAIGLLSPGEWNEKLGAAVQGVDAAATVQKDKAKADLAKNQTVSMLEKDYPMLAQAVRSGNMDTKTAWSEAIKLKSQKAEFKQLDDGTYGTWDGQQFKPLGKTAKNSFMNLGKGLIYDTSTGKYITPPPGTADDTTEYGLTPVWFVDKQGTKRLGLPGKNGTMKILDNPDGLTPLPGVNNIDTGTAFQTQDKKSGQIISTVPKDVAGAAEQKKLGENTADAKNQLASARETAKMVEKGVTDLLKDPGLDNVVGPVNSRLPTFFPSSVRAETQIDALKGQAFLQARQMLKGGGAITDYEGAKAEAAFARMNNAQSPEDFRTALTDFNTAVQEGVKKLEAQSQGNFDYDPRTQTQSNSQNTNTTSTGVTWKKVP